MNKYWDMYNRGTSAEMDSLLQALANKNFQFVGEEGPLSLDEQKRIMQSGEGAHQSIDNLIMQNTLKDFLSAEELSLISDNRIQPNTLKDFLVNDQSDVVDWGQRTHFPRDNPSTANWYMEPSRERNIQDIIADIVTYQEDAELMGPEHTETRFKPEMQRGYDIGNILNR